MPVSCASCGAAAQLATAPEHLAGTARTWGRQTRQQNWMEHCRLLSSAQRTLPAGMLPVRLGKTRTAARRSARLRCTWHMSAPPSKVPLGCAFSNCVLLGPACPCADSRAQRSAPVLCRPAAAARRGRGVHGGGRAGGCAVPGWQHLAVKPGRSGKDWLDAQQPHRQGRTLAGHRAHTLDAAGAPALLYGPAQLRLSVYLSQQTAPVAWWC